jgi:hypothetical protein
LSNRRRGSKKSKPSQKRPATKGGAKPEPTAALARPTPPADVDAGDPLSFMTVVANAFRLYVAHLWPTALLFGTIALGISLLALVGLADIGRPQLFLVFLSQIALPAFLGSVGLACSSILFRSVPDGTEDKGLRWALRQLKPMLRPVAFASLFSSMLCLWAIILLGRLGFVLMPLFFGPPILIQVVAMERLALTDARKRAWSLVSGSTFRVVLYVLVTVLALGLLDGAVLSLAVALAQSSNDGLTAILVFSVLQIGVAAFSLPFLAAVEHVTYESLVEKGGRVPA